MREGKRPRGVGIGIRNGEEPHKKALRSAGVFGRFQGKGQITLKPV